MRLHAGVNLNRWLILANSDIGRANQGFFSLPRLPQQRQHKAA